jgi:hypothetical protein
MQTNAEFFRDARSKFPALAEKADSHHVKYWGEPPTEAQDSYSWFESVSRALNAEMKGEAYLKEARRFFVYVETVFCTAGDEVKKCVDVAFVENLFWQVSPEKAAPYWQQFPKVLQELYFDFHRRTPL